MVKKFFVIGAIIGCLVPAIALADKYGLDDTAKSAGLPVGLAGENTIEGAAGSIVVSLLAFLGILFFGLVFYAGIKWMTARGNEEAITKAKDTIEAAAIGLVLVAGAYAIASFVLSTLASDQSQQQLSQPQSETCSLNPGGTCISTNDPRFSNSCDTVYSAAKNCAQDEICCKAI